MAGLLIAACNVIEVRAGAVQHTVRRLGEKRSRSSSSRKLSLAQEPAVLHSSWPVEVVLSVTLSEHDVFGQIGRENNRQPE